MSDPVQRCLAQLDALRTELTDEAFVLETRDRLDAADVANGIAGRVAEIRAELSGVKAEGRLQAVPGDRN